ncbi:MAG: hypothetical protein ABI811_18865 [Acidobacteriota bacterium]
MNTNALYRSDDPNYEPRQAQVASPCAEDRESLLEMSSSELQFMQEITLQQMRETKSGTELLVLGRVWYRLEQERRRRKAEVAALESMYFGR